MKKTILILLLSTSALICLLASNVKKSTGTPPGKLHSVLPIPCGQGVPDPINGMLGSGSFDWPADSNTKNWRLVYDANPSTCASPKTCPGTVADGDYVYDAYIFSNRSTTEACVTVALTNNYSELPPVPTLFMTAYQGSYQGPCENYLGDSGSTTTDDNLTLSMSITVPPMTDLVVVVSEGAAGSASGTSYTLEVTGLPECLGIELAPWLPDVVAGMFYEAMVSATPDYGPYTYTIVSGALPPGLTLDPSTGTISGTCNEIGSFNFTIQATNTCNCAAQQAYTLGSGCAGFSIYLIESTLVVANPFTAKLQTDGGVPPVAFRLSSGELPPGLALSIDGVISGTPTQTGTYSFQVMATDKNLCNGYTDFTVDVVCDPPMIFQPPEVGEVPGGEPFTLRVEVYGSEPMVYQWYEGETGDVSNPVPGANEPVFTTPPVNQVLKYWVKVNNFCGEINSDTAVLTPRFELFGAHASTTGWNTRLVVVNTGTEAQPLTFEAYDDSGTRLTTVITAPLPPKALYMRDLYRIFGNTDLPGSFWVRVVGRAPLAGMLMFEPPTGAEPAIVPMTRRTHSPLTFANLADDTWTAFAIANPGNQTTDVALDAYAVSGTYLGGRRLTLPADGHWAGFLDAVAVGHPEANLVQVTSSQPLVGIELVGQFNGNGFTALPALVIPPTVFGFDRHEAGIPFDQYLHLVPPGVGDYAVDLSIFNLQELATPVWAAILNSAGQPLVKTNWEMPPLAGYAGLLPAVQGAVEVKVGAVQPSAAVELFVSLRYPDQITALTAEALSGRRLCFPVVSLPSSGLAVLTLTSFANIMIAPASVTVTAYDATGKVLGMVIRTMSDGPFLELDIGSAFPGVTNIAWLDVRANQLIKGTLFITPAVSNPLVCYNGIMLE